MARARALFASDQPPNDENADLDQQDQACDRGHKKHIAQRWMHGSPHYSARGEPASVIRRALSVAEAEGLADAVRERIRMLLKGCLRSVDLDQGWTRSGT